MTPPDWIRKTVASAQQRAKAKGVPFNLTAEDMVVQWDTQQGQCYWFGVHLGFDEATPYHPLTPSLDRVVPGHGYTVGNVVWACLAANAAKRDTDPDCWEEFLQHLRVGLALK